MLTSVSFLFKKKKKKKKVKFIALRDFNRLLIIFEIAKNNENYDCDNQNV